MRSACEARWKNKANSWRAGRLGTRRIRETKPNLGRMGHLGDGASGRANGAKRTQFPPGQIPHHSTIPSFRRSNPLRNVQNKPNSGRAGLPVAPIVRNKPNSAAAAGEVSAKQSQSAGAGRTTGVPRPPARARRTGRWGSLGLRLRRSASGVIIPPVQMVRRPQGCLQAEDRVNAELQTTEVERWKRELRRLCSTGAGS